MYSHVAPTAGPIPYSPPHDPLDFIPIGSLEEEIPSQPSEEDHEHEQGQDQDQNENHENSSATGVLTDDLKNKIIKQVEYYFSNENFRQISI